MYDYLKIRQSYHGTGGREGYRYGVYNDKDKKLGELKISPTDLCDHNVVAINKTLYEVVFRYDSPNPRHEKSEVVFYELEKYEPSADIDLGEIVQIKRRKTIDK